METWRKELYLTHHGIKGQQWGVRRGPPYPLKSSKTQNVGYVSKGADPNDPERNKPIGDSGKSLSVLSADAKNIAIAIQKISNNIQPCETSPYNLLV